MSCIRPRQFGLRTLLASIAVLAPCVAIVAWKLREPARREHAQGRADAERAWESKSAVWFVSDDRPYDYVKKGIVFSFQYDHATGLPVALGDRRWPHFFAGYKSRVRELLQANGTPTWSAKRFLVSDQDLLDVLAAPPGPVVDRFPHEVNNYIVIRRGTIHMWNESGSSGTASLGVYTPDGLSGADGPVHVIHRQKFPELIFIREGDQGVSAYHVDGRFVASATRP